MPFSVLFSKSVISDTHVRYQYNQNIPSNGPSGPKLPHNNNQIPHIEPQAMPATGRMPQALQVETLRVGG